MDFKVSILKYIINLKGAITAEVKIFTEINPLIEDPSSITDEEVNIQININSI